MALTSYVDYDFYKNVFGGALEEAEAIKWLKSASRHIDTLTFNRIRAVGFDQLTDFQKQIIQECVCIQAEFEDKNQDVFESLLSGYSVNGVSVNFGDSLNVITKNGVLIKQDLYSFLEQTGLCCKRLGAV